MSDPKAQIETQLRNIEKSSGKTVADFTAVVREAGLEKRPDSRNTVRSCRCSSRSTGSGTATPT